jgi:hypothetical protein
MSDVTVRLMQPELRIIAQRLDRHLGDSTQIPDLEHDAPRYPVCLVLASTCRGLGISYPGSHQYTTSPKGRVKSARCLVSESQARPWVHQSLMLEWAQRRMNTATCGTGDLLAQSTQRSQSQSKRDTSRTWRS